MTCAQLDDFAAVVVQVDEIWASESVAAMVLVLVPIVARAQIHSVVAAWLVPATKQVLGPSSPSPLASGAWTASAPNSLVDRCEARGREMYAHSAQRTIR